MPGNKFKWNSYNDDNLVAAFDMSTRTAGGLMKNLAKTGAVYDAVINGVFVPANPLIRAKKTKCMDFDGVNNYITLANPIQNLTIFSFVCWANMDALGGMFFSKVIGVNTYFYVDAVGRIRLEIVGTGTTVKNKQTPIVNRSYMFVCTKDSSNIAQFFVDGQFVWSGAVGASEAEVNLFIGRYGGGGGFIYDGRLDNMLFYNTALDASQINSIYRSSLPR